MSIDDQGEKITFQWEGGEYQWQYTRKETLTSENFVKQLLQTLRQNDVISFGEFHDENRDQSFSWLSEYEHDIYEAYNICSTAQSVTNKRVTLKQCVPHNSLLLTALSNSKVDFNQLRGMHAGRLFGLLVISLTQRAGFTDIVFEGDPGNPEIVKLSKDKIGDLFRLTAGLFFGVRAIITEHFTT